MFEPKNQLKNQLRAFFKLFTDTGPLIVLAVVIAALIGGPAAAQFSGFPGFGGFGGFGGPSRASRGGGFFGGDFFSPFQQQQPKRVYQDFSKAPPPEKRDSIPERNVMVMGDGMADWLAYGLEDAYTDQPDMGVIRKAKNTSGLIKYQPKGDPADWAAAAKQILATEKPDVIVVMLGLNDRVAMREPVSEKPEKGDKAAEKKAEKDKKEARGKGDGKAAEGKPQKPDAAPDAEAKPDEKTADTELPPEDSEDAPPPVPTEKSTRSPNGLYEFRDDRWIELYTKKIDDMIAVVKSKGVPVVWVGLPAIRGPKGTSDILFLDSLYRDAANKAGVTYVDVWDGFVDERGLFLQKGPDFEGQIRQLRSYDGVYFTKPGARKLAHYVEREITRLLAGRSAPIALPTEPATPEANAVPGQPAPRPITGPIVPLVASNVGTDQLLGGAGTRPAAVDALAARTLVKGEALNAPAGRADDFSWPHREIGRELAKEPPKSETPVATTAPGGASVPPGGVPGVAPQTQQQQQQKRPQQPARGPFQNFFGFGSPSPPPRQFAPPPRSPIAPPGVPRPPANVGRSASAPADPVR